MAVQSPCRLHQHHTGSSRADNTSEAKLRQGGCWVFINRALGAAPLERAPDLRRGSSIKLLTITWKELNSELPTANTLGNYGTECFSPEGEFEDFNEGPQHP